MEVEEGSTNMHDLPSEQSLYSFVIPAFNEAPRLSSGLNQLRSFVDQQGLTCEVVVVNDGSTDDTAAVVRRWIREWPVVRLVDGPHRGKGGAVRAGIIASTGGYIALAGPNFAMPAAVVWLFPPRRARLPAGIGPSES